MSPMSVRPLDFQPIFPESRARQEVEEEDEAHTVSSQPANSSGLQVSLQAAAQQHALNPKERVNSATTSTPTSFGSSPVDELVSEQFKELANICSQLTKQEGVTLQNLLDLSWGIGSIPKEVKFSKRCSGIEDRHWLLLEDICRQITNQFPDTSDFDTLPQGWEELAHSFPAYAEELKGAFESFRRSQSIEKNEKLFAHFKIVEDFFEPHFDAFILEQIKLNIEAINGAVAGISAAAWLQEEPNIKALFRTVEVIGEASKIVGKKNKGRLLTLAMNAAEVNGANGGPLRGKLRNQLHHHKSRTIQIAMLAPEKWVEIIETLFPKLLKEISDPTHSTPVDENDRNILFSLIALCSEDHYRPIQKRWREVENDFTSSPLELKRFLFGLDKTLSEKNYSEIWEDYAKPFLRASVCEESNKTAIFDLFRLRSRNLLKASDIDRLRSSRSPQDKKEVVDRLKQLLSKVKAKENTEEEIREFEFLAGQLLFFKIEKNKIGRDKSKNETLKKVMSRCLSQSHRFEFSGATFENKDERQTDYPLLLSSYKDLKSKTIYEMIGDLLKSLNEIKDGWPEGNLDEKGMQSFANEAPKGKGNLKQTFTSLFDKLCKELLIDDNFPQTGGFSLQEINRVNELCKSLKLFPTQRIIKQGFSDKKGGLRLADLIVDRTKSLETIQSLIEMFSNLHITSQQIEDKVQELLNRATEIYNSERITQEDVTELKSILNLFSFPDNRTLFELLQKANLPHPFEETLGSDLNRLRQQVVNSFEGRLVTDFDQQIEALTSEASDELPITFVQKLLYSNPDATSTFHQEGEGSPPITLELLGEIYSSSLYEDEKQAKLLEWKNIERRLTNRHLPIEKFEKVVGWLQDDDSSQEKKSLLDYLNGIKKLEIKDCSPFDYTTKKIELFEKFLDEECISKFPALKDKKTLLLSYFKIAYGIADTNQKSINFAERLKRKINNLGKIFAKVLEGERKGERQKELKILLLAAEYDLQDIGELAKLITEKESFWDSGCHILSSSHLFSIALMRKMMAHYPLHLTSDTLRWNLEYLAFDTSSHYSDRREVSENIEMANKTNRGQITHKILNKQLFKIKDLADRLNLKLDIDVLYPSIDQPQHSFVHPFADLSLVVYPAPDCDSQQNFLYSTMEFELVLNHKLEGKVCVIGNWGGQLINIPSDKYTPKIWLERALHKKENIDDWIASKEYYEIFKTKPWTLIRTTSGDEISIADYKLHRHLLSFLKTLDMPSDPEGFKQSVQRTDLGNHILNRITVEWNCSAASYPESTFFEWVCSLYEYFSPPGVTPKNLVKLPKKSGKERPLTTMIGQNNHALLFLPEEWEGQLPSNHPVAPYYRENKRRDIINGSSVLNPDRTITPSDLSLIADYAAEVLKNQVDYLVEKLNPCYGLPPSLFCHIDNIDIGDTTLQEPPPPPEAIPADVQTLVNSEAKELAVPMSNFITKLSLRLGANSCREFLNWLKIDKEIDVIARRYYLSNEARLSGPYVQMDPTSRQFFDNKHLSKGRLEEFSFVNCYQRFFGEITFEIDSFALLPDGVVKGDFSTHMKELIPEIEDRIPLLELMKKRKITTTRLASTLNSKNPFLVNEVNLLFFRSEKLFRMVHDPSIFDDLASCIETNNKPNRRRIYSKLRADFMAQYISDQYEQSYSIARHVCRNEGIPILNARDYFKLKSSIDKKESHRATIDELKKKTESAPFINEWNRLGCLASLYNDSPTTEAREALDRLLHRNDLPDDEGSSLIHPQSYSEYWTFVENNPIKMETQPRAIGKFRNFKNFIFTGGTFQDLTLDRTKRAALNKNPKLSKLIERYISFAPIENALSNSFSYLNQQREAHRELLANRESAILANKDSWVISRFDEKLRNCEKRIESGKKKCKELIEQIMKTEFFKLLQFSEKWKAYTQDEGMITDENLVKRVVRSFIMISDELEAFSGLL